MKFDTKQLQDMADKAVEQATHITEGIRETTESKTETKTDGSSTGQVPMLQSQTSTKRSAREDNGMSRIRSMDHRTRVIFGVLLGVIVFLLILVGIVGCGSSRNTSGMSRIAMPESAESLVGKQYEDVVMQLQSAGFTNVQTKKKEDLITGWITKEGEVEQVSVNGDTDFTTYDKFDPNATIIITYHAFPDKDKASDSGNGADTTGGDADSDDTMDGSDSDDTEQSQEESPQPQPEPITAQNNAEFAALLTGSETGDTVRSFAERYAGRTIAFDGYTADVQSHDGAKTRFDYLILSGDAGTSRGGPNFRFTDVSYYDLHLGDGAPDSFGVGLNIHVEATIERYDPNTSWFELTPIAITMR